MTMSDDPRELLQRLEHIEQHIKRFSPEDWEMMHKLTRAYMTWAMLGSATKWFVLLLASISGIIISINHIGGAIRKWLLG
jgi:hypothetical protein